MYFQEYEIMLTQELLLQSIMYQKNRMPKLCSWNEREVIDESPITMDK